MMDDEWWAERGFVLIPIEPYQVWPPLPEPEPEPDNNMFPESLPFDGMTDDEIREALDGLKPLEGVPQPAPPANDDDEHWIPF